MATNFLNLRTFMVFSPQNVDFKMILCSFILSLIFCSCVLSKESENTSYDRIYTSGVKAYESKNWFECYSQMKKAISALKTYQYRLIGCRKYCQSETAFPQWKTDEIIVVESILHRSDCIRRCKASRHITNIETINTSVKSDIDDLLPYDYLQICAYKVERYEDAAAAAYTYLAAHPDYEIMQQNVDFYRLMPEIKDEYFVDLERNAYQDSYERGVDLYNGENYAAAVEEFERALRQYYTGAEKCRLLCEDTYDHQGAFPDIYNALADHWVDVIRCRKKCAKKMTMMNGEKHFNILPEMYNYLQFSYYKIGDTKAAARACASYLQFHPDNEAMLNNRRYYMTDLGVSEAEFECREEAAEYDAMQRAEQRLFEYIDTKYTFSNADLDSQGKDIPEPESEDMFPDPYGDFLEDASLLKDSAELAADFQEYVKQNDLDIVSEGEELEGATRVVVDKLITEEECSTLMQLVQDAGTQGDGYKVSEDQSSPHTQYERFLGVTVSKAAQMASSGGIESAAVQTYLRASQASRDFIEKYNHLQTPLHFHYTHLVCRTALDDQEGREDLSHPIHADNCLLQEDGSCLKMAPAYTSRDYSSLLYLNDDFEGGDFLFADANQTVQTKVRPKCGRMVSFEAGTFHGVEAITSGTRCALAIWYTLDATQREGAHREAELLLRGLQSRNKPLQNPTLKTLVDTRGYEIVFTESELNGPERFAADNVISDEMCQALIDLAVQSSVENDGYSHKGALQSPHSQHEAFTGLTLDRAAESGGVANEGYNHKGALQSPHSRHENYKGLTVTHAVKEKGSNGDGYNERNDGSSFSHTEHELFSGIDVLTATKLAKKSQLKPQQVYNFLKSSQDSMHLVETYFNLSTPLYFDYTHLVCRTARNDENKDRKDLSHPIHSDNCLIKPDGRCVKERPAYIQRDYSALLYLNGDFEGGEFIFTDTDFSIQSSLSPRCGRLVGFNASNYHGVQAVLSGRRCALAMWYTLDSSYSEYAHKQAQQMLDKINFKPEVTAKDEL